MESMKYSKKQALDVLDEYVHNRQDREVMLIYLTNRPRSMEVLAEECDLAVSTVKRIVRRNKFVYNYLDTNSN